MKGELVLCDQIYDAYFGIGSSLTNYFSLEVYLDEDTTLEERLKERESFDKDVSIIRELGIESDSRKKEINYISEHFDNILDSVEYINLSFYNIDVLEFIKKNPIVLSKKIVIGETLDINDYDRVVELMTEYNDILDKAYISLIGNDNYVSLVDCYKTINAIRQRANDIKKLGLSPMETIMYVYDQVRNRKYRIENNDDAYYKSRDLTEVIFGDKIVCLGYANMFNALLCDLGIRSNLVILENKKNKERGHARNIIYVKDDKYDIDGVYYFDPTWDSRKDDTNEYLYRYKYFAKTRKYMDDDENYDFKDEFLPKYSVTMDRRIKKIIKEGDYKKLEPYINSLNYMSRLVTGSFLVSRLWFMPDAPKCYNKFDPDRFMEQFKIVFSKFNKEIPAETMLTLLNNVRKLEYYQNPELYPYSPEDIYKTFIINNWKFEGEHLSKEMILYRNIFGIEMNLTQLDYYRNFGMESNMFREIGNIKLAKVLQHVREKKQNRKNTTM